MKHLHLLLLFVVVLEPGPGARNPLSLARPIDERFEGVVEERLDAGSYQYLRVRDDLGAKRWVATLRRGASPAGRVSVHAFALADRFESKRVSHVFTPLSFGSVTVTPTQESP